MLAHILHVSLDRIPIQVQRLMLSQTIISGSPMENARSIVEETTPLLSSKVSIVGAPTIFHQTKSARMTAINHVQDFQTNGVGLLTPVYMDISCLAQVRRWVPQLVLLRLPQLHPR